MHGAPSLAWCLSALIACVAWLAPRTACAQGAEPPPMVPDDFVLSGEVEATLEAAYLTDTERRRLAAFHGAWAAIPPEGDVLADAMIALAGWQLDDPVFTAEGVPPTMRAEALVRRGDLDAAAQLLADRDDLASRRLRAEALAGLGRHAAAVDVLDGIAVDASAVLDREDPAEMTELARARILSARLEGASGATYRSILALLARVHQQVDRVHWPALLAEAELLHEKQKTGLAVQAYHAVLQLNPRSDQAWYGLGRLALSRFDFGGALRAASALERIADDHPLAAMLVAELRLVQDDPEGAEFLLELAVERAPDNRMRLALAAAAAATSYDTERLAERLAAFDARSPGSPLAHAVAGRFMSLFRQYDAAADLLQEAIDRQPNWGEPRLALGLMEMQTGRDDRALAILREATRIDPFNVRAANSLALVTELQEYGRLETEHFIVRYRPGIDEVLVARMAEPLEAMHADIAELFGWDGGDGDERTIIELMPDHERFAVRITGMPRLFTIAACTGPVIAMEVPRDGLPSKHQGPFDWERVMRHEYTHTVTLAKTSNRIPHWLTEGAAVAMERAPRSWSDCLMLAAALEQDELFTLDEIKWGFVRPRTPVDRAMAYAQSQWMLEFMLDRYGRPAVIELLRQYDEGVREQDAIPSAFGIGRDAFYLAFLEWAREEVTRWGLRPEPSLEFLVKERGEAVLAMIEDEDAQGPGSTMDRVDPAAGNEGEGAEGGGDLGPAGLPGGAGGGAGGDGPRGPDGEPLIDGGAPDLRRPVLDDQLVTELLVEHPDHPDLLKTDLRRRIVGGEPFGPALQADLLRYAAVRPPDPFPHQHLARAFLESDDPAQAIPHLEFLDRREQRSWAFSRKLAELHRAAGATAEALASVERAIGFDPYHAPNRELAAAIAIEAGRFDVARGHIEALTLLEPDRALHQRRLEALDRLQAG